MKFLTKEDFSYELPSELIAQEPLSERDQARLLVYRDGTFQHSHIKDLAQCIPEQSLLILNDTRVFSSRLLGKTPNNGKIEIFLLETPEAFESGSRFKALAKPFSKLDKYPQSICLGGEIPTRVLEMDRSADLPFAYFAVDLPPDEFLVWMEQKGFVPLPPYIRRPLDQDLQARDKTRYQTVYANTPGAVAAPTAGLHFTQSVFDSLAQKGIEIAPVTLHVGAGTFAPVKASDPREHNMHTEKFFVPRETWHKISTALANNRPVIAIGTTSLRAIESLMVKSEGLEPLSLCGAWHETNLFIYPKSSEERYVSKVFSAMITNFHQPESTLLMLISSLLGFEKAKALYAEAIEKKYRFFSYGDTSLLWFRASLLKSETKTQDP